MSGESVDVYPMVSRATLDTMLRCVMSYNDDTVQNTGYKILMCYNICILKEVKKSKNIKCDILSYIWGSI
jgi:hypothetical protein